MSKLSALQGKPQVFKIGETELELKPLTVDELELFSMDENAPIEKQLENSKKLIKVILKKSVPDATDEEINGISLEHLTDLMEAVTKLHNLKTEKTSLVKQKIQDVIKARQAQAASQGTS